MAHPVHTISLKLPAPLHDALNALARRRKSNRSALVREALETITRAKQPSVVAAAGELVGSLDGPTDLSSHAKHMRGYGK